MKRWVKRHKVWSTLIGSIILFLGACVIAVSAISAHLVKPSGPLTTSQNHAACALDGQDFMSTVNRWRSAAGVPAVAYSTSLESGASARLADMVTGQYYGHTNPQTKVQSYTLVMQYDTATTSESEVLDANSSSAQELTDLRSSPEHYAALIDAKYAYFGGLAVYQPESWASYDNIGNLQQKAGINHANCIILGELADKNSTQATKAASTTTPTSSQKSCFTTVLPFATTYQDVSWLNAGQTEASALTGINGYRTICDGITTAYSAPNNAVLYRGTKVATPIYTPPPLQQYVPTTPPPDHQGCVQAVRAKGYTGDADALCVSYGY